MSFRWVILALCLSAVARIEDCTVYLNAFDRASSDLEAGPLAGLHCGAYYAEMTADKPAGSRHQSLVRVRLGISFHYGAILAKTHAEVGLIDSVLAICPGVVGNEF